MFFSVFVLNIKLLIKSSFIRKDLLKSGLMWHLLCRILCRNMLVW